MVQINLDGLEKVDNWIDGQSSEFYQRQPLAQDWARVSKIGEEMGEAIQALIGYTGQNPRKGFTHSRGQVLDELADVAYTAIAAIQHFTKDQQSTALILQRKINSVADRIRHSQES